jgi:dipeptidase E
MALRLLLLSNSRDAAGTFLEWPRDAIRSLLGDARRLVFVPYASVRTSADDYTTLVRGALGALGHEVRSVHESDDPAAAVRNAEGIVVGGGNTFHLLKRLQETNLLAALRDRARAGVPYLGWSAGSVVAGPTIRTTNDMPIVEVPSLDALGLIPVQINAHYTDAHPPGFRGETRAERLTEFVTVNPTLTVVGLPEGTGLRVEGARVSFFGGEPARVFRHGRDVVLLRPGESLDASPGDPATR